MSSQLTGAEQSVNGWYAEMAILLGLNMESQLENCPSVKSFDAHSIEI